MTDRVDELAAQIAQLEQRLAQLERAVTAAATPSASAAASTASPDASVAATAIHARASAAGDATAEHLPLDVALVGRSVIVLGGAYLLRATTELAVVPDALGVAAGLGYALSLLALAHRAAHRADARRGAASSLFHVVTALAIALPIVDEMVLRFHLIGPRLGAALMLACSAPALVLAYQRRVAAVAWIAVTAPLGALLVLAVQTRDLPSGVCAISLLAVAAAGLARRVDQRFLMWPIAIGGDLLVMPMMQLVIIDRSGYSVTAALVAGGAFLLVFTAGAMARTIAWSRATTVASMVQAVAVFLLVVVEGAWFPLSPVARSAGAALLVALAAAGTAATVRWLARDPSRRLAAAFWSSLWLAVALTALVVAAGPVLFAIGAIAIAAALLILARAYDHELAELHAVVALAAAAARVGLLTHAAAALGVEPALPARPGIAMLLVLAAIVVAALSQREPRAEAGPLAGSARVALLALAVAAVGGELAWLTLRLTGAAAGIAATLRTAILSGAAVALALASRHPRARSASLLVYPLLVAAAAKLVVEDLRVGVAMTLFAGFALYGAALIIAPRLRHRTPAPRSP